MKKSNKKVKSDRINALRKQYDAFLEEDKKRKERNDLILNKLDKMRYSNAPVTLRTTPTLYISQQSGLYNKGKPLENSSICDRYMSSPTQQSPFEISKKHLDDSFMLQEITKKYILIPKRSSMLVNEYPEAIKPVTDGDSDWKSKYDILNQLEHNDKVVREEDKKSPIKETNHSKNDELFLDVSHYKAIGSNYASETLITQQHQLVRHTDENPVKDVIDTNTNNDTNIENHGQYVDTAIIKLNGKNYDNNKTQNVSPEVMNNLECNVNTFKLDQDVTLTPTNKSVEKIAQQIISNENLPISNTLEYSEVNSNNDHTDNEYLRQNESLETYNQNNTQGSIVGLVESVNVSLDNNLNSIQEMKPESLVEERTNNNKIVTAEEFKHPEDIEYPIEIINVQDFTPDENVNLQDGVNVNPRIDREDSSVPQNESQNESIVETENPIDMSGIEAFDAEQRQMFYSEQPNENYTYDQSNSENTYQEYPQNENYQQNEEYGYYQDVPPDQNYPTVVNEFEETSQPYDQTYQEQYAAYDPEYVQQETYEQQSQEYEGIQEMVPNIQPEVEQLQYEQLNYEPHSVEQQLDSDQGYTDNVELDKNNFKVTDNTKIEESKNLTSQALDNSEVQENLIQDDKLNN